MDIDWESLFQTYGYLSYVALFIGTFLEGETIVILAGIAASKGYLKLDLLILSSFLGSLSGDQCAFYVGRFWGNKFIQKRPNWQSRVEQVHRLLSRYHEILILSFRFFYGLRNLTPFILGTTEVSGKKFLLLNAIGAAVWAVAFGFAGHAFGAVIEKLLEDVKHAQLIALGVIVVIMLALWLRKLFKKKK